jgi:hypothetical protein
MVKRLHVVREGEGFRIAEVVGYASDDIPLANVRAGDPLTITWPSLYATVEAASQVIARQPR